PYSQSLAEVWHTHAGITSSYRHRSCSWDCPARNAGWGGSSFDSNLSVVNSQKLRTQICDPHRRRSMVPLPGRFNVSQPDRPAPCHRIRFQSHTCKKGRMVLPHLHYRELPRHVQYQIRIEPALPKYVGAAIACPRFQSITGSDWGRHTTMAAHRAICRCRTYLRTRGAQLHCYGGG